MNREERARLREAVLNARRVLEEEFDVCLRLHGLLPERPLDAERIPPDKREARAALDEALRREGLPYPEARERWKRHAAFTFLNRLLAVRVAEANGLITETVVPRPEYGHRSLRERDLADADPALATEPEGLVHRAFGEACAELGVPLLFPQEGDPYGLLTPRLPAYQRVREEIAGVPEAIWREFESLGWAYQYFNDEVRRQIRAELRRNPRPDQIPPLNQFYTVSWIVKFLVHNTLGRLWVEAHPASALAGKLSYLVPRPGGFRAPREELRVEDLKVLDPACGSGHFLLQAFDLLFEMWREAHPNVPVWEIPGKILEHNLYGVDIDLRACQIAALALYLKARTLFERHKTPGALFRPARLNIVCTDIRFTDGGRRREFLEGIENLFGPRVRQAAAQILDATAEGYQIGSLLKIEGPLWEALNEAATDLGTGVKRIPVQARLWGPQAPIQLQLPSQGASREELLQALLRAIGVYTRQVAAQNDMGSLFFGLDAGKAVSLIEVLGQRYDVVLMNPPYGAMPPACKEYARERYPRTHSDYYAAFIERAVELARPGGYVGALTGRTFLFLKSFQRLREEILRHEALPETVLDLGFNVLDGATARWAAFTLRKRWAGDGVNWREHPVTFFRLTPWQWDDKRVKFEEALAGVAASGNVAQKMERV